MDERVRILTSLREYLTHKHEKFKEYLNLLEKEKEAILNNDIERIQRYVELEQTIVGEIYTLQRVIDPLEEMYCKSYPEHESGTQELKGSLNRLKEKALISNKRNRSLLKNKMTVLRQRIDSSFSRTQTRSPFAEIGVPSLVDISS